MGRGGKGGGRGQVVGVSKGFCIITIIERRPIVIFSCAWVGAWVRPSVRNLKSFFFVFFVYIDRCFSTLIHSNFIHREFLNFALHGYMQFFRLIQLFSLTKSHKYMKIYTFKHSSKKHSWFCLRKKSLRIRIGNEILLHTTSNM